MKYCIIHTNDRAKHNMAKNISILKKYEYVDNIEYFDGNVGNGWDVLNHMKIPLDRWKPYDGRTTPPLPGEYGIWVSTIKVFEYIIKNNIEQMLVLEDDIVLDKNFIKNLNLCINDLPKSYGFLSLYYFDNHNWIDELTDMGSAYIHKSYNQFSSAQAMLYSYSGAKKILTALKRKGLEYTPDCFIYRQSLEGVIEGYSIKPNTITFLSHDNKNIKSIIDPSNSRNT